MFDLKNYLEQNEDYSIPCYTLALKGINFSYLIKIIGEANTFKYCKQMSEYYNHFVNIPRIDMWPLIISVDGYIQSEHHIAAAALAAGFKEVCFFQRDRSEYHQKYTLDWAKDTFGDISELDNELSSLLNKINR
jgi:hypothetical protein